MVLQSFLSVLERKNSMSFTVLPEVNSGIQVAVAVVNMGAIESNPEIGAMLTCYGNTVPSIFLYDEGQPIVEKYAQTGNITKYRPINFTEIAATTLTLIKSKKPEVTRSFGPNCSVLVVDDSPSVRADMRYKLAGSGVDIETANDAEEALSMVAKKAYGLIFMDVLMPGSKDGYDACREIKTKTPDVPVVLLTSRDSISSKIRGRMAKCDQYIIKPATEGKVHEILRTYLLRDSDDDDLLFFPDFARA